MSPADIAAYIGAAAWLPQIGKWIYGAWAKPKLRVVPAGTVMLTYSNLGPTVQLTASLSTDRCDALIERIELEMSHELGEKRHLIWVLISEFGQQLTVPTGEVMNFGRNQPATAIKITTETLTDRQIVLQDPDFAKKARTLGDEVLDHYRFLKTKDEDPMKTLLESKEIRPAREYFERSFYWKPGRYTFEISLKSASLSKDHVQKFEVVLSTADSDLLASNCKFFGEYVSAAILGEDGIPSKYPTWKWVQARITPPLILRTHCDSSRKVDILGSTVHELCKNPMFSRHWGLALSEKQIPQIAENIERPRYRMELLERVVVRPRQARYQAALRPDDEILAENSAKQ